MIKIIFIAIFGLLAGITISVYLNYFKTAPLQHTKEVPEQVIGFLPYWLLDKAKTSYADDITTLTYFGLNVDGNGRIVKLANPQEEDPGWHALSSGKLDPFFANAREHKIKLSLLISSGDTSAIQQLLLHPVQHANTLVTDIAPLMKQYHFSDLNIDIEYTSSASDAAQTHFTQFVKTVKQNLTTRHLGTLTVEVSPTDVIFHHLINIHDVAPFTDTIVLMAYDYHSTVSSVTGPVAPLNGAGLDSEYDVTTAVEKTLASVPPQKLMLGIPLYGYEWEALSTSIHSAILPGTGVLASNDRMETFLSSCATCNTFFDNEAQEEFVLYKDQTTGTFHQAFFPNQQSVKAKIAFAKKEHLGGLALWALGYEGSTMLTPFTNYK